MTVHTLVLLLSKLTAIFILGWWANELICYPKLELRLDCDNIHPYTLGFFKTEGPSCFLDMFHLEKFGLKISQFFRYSCLIFDWLLNQEF